MKRAKLLAGVGLALLLGVLLVGCGEKSSDSESKTYHIGIVNAAFVFDELVEHFQAHLTDSGFTDVTYTIAATPDELQSALGSTRVDLILCSPAGFGGNNYVKMIQAFAKDTPIVFAPGSLDPVAEGLAASITKPGGNVTGILMTEAGDGRRLEYMLHAFPDLQRVAVPYNATNIVATQVLPDLRKVAAEHEIELIELEATEDSVPSAQAQIASLPQDVDGVFLLKIWVASLMWYEAGMEHGWAVSQDGEVDFGDLHPVLVYGPRVSVQGEQAARLAAQILRGVDPGSLPIEQSQLFLTIDLGVADALGLEIPATMLRQADTLAYSEVEMPEMAAATETEPAAAAGGTGACRATQTSPGGSNQVCITAVCADLVDGAMVSFTDKEDVGDCPTAGAVGVCVTDAMTTTYYDGAPDMLNIGCGFAGGTWSTDLE